MAVKVLYEFVGGFCDHQHPSPESLRQGPMGNPFNHGWECCTLAFHSRDWFSGPVNAWLKSRLAEVGIPWREFAPKSKPTPFVRVLASEHGMSVAEVSDEEADMGYGMWAALQQGGSIFQDTCVTPGCVNYDAMAHLLPEKVDVTIHAPVEVVDMLLSDLYDWNHSI